MAENDTDRQTETDRPMPGPGDQATDSQDSDTKVTSDTDVSDYKYGEDETQDYVDRSKIDFDPEDGLYTGTAIEGDTDIPGPHQDEETTGDPDAMAEKAEQMAKDEGTEDKIGEGASGSAVGKGQDGSQDDISGG